MVADGALARADHGVRQAVADRLTVVLGVQALFADGGLSALGLNVLLVLTSVLLVVLILLHRGKGGGLSTLFGGGVSSSLGGSAVVEKNLDRMTIICGLVWIVSIIALGLLLKETGTPAA